ncbi:hypothetical protein ACFY8C_30705 [Streptomyces flavochromogenes]|uniref:Transposase n=1 Tax=Streptomyces flavochromogenes TaxID=68199 RepID=A0ABW6XYQ9_9ACTN|nr:transposase [Streptomyces flavochromogenes]
MPGWLRGRGGQPEAYCHRVMLNAIRYLVDNGPKRRATPADFPCGTGSTRPSGAGATKIWSASSTTGSAAWSASGPGGTRSRARA